MMIPEESNAKLRNEELRRLIDEAAELLRRREPDIRFAQAVRLSGPTRQKSPHVRRSTNRSD